VDADETDDERQAYIARIEEVNDSLKAVLQINPDARSIALQFDDERSRGILRRYTLQPPKTVYAALKCRSPLHGLPILLKGNIATCDNQETNGMKTTFLCPSSFHASTSLTIITAGSFALCGTRPREDSTIARKLRAAGMILLGKTHLTEFSMFRSSTMSWSWNAVAGQAYGAYFPKQCPGGSSGGSAVAADLGLAWATVGTEVRELRPIC
jgi:amidase